MFELIRESQPIAKKKYNCDAWYWYNNADMYEELTDDEKTAVRNCAGKINPGEKYIYVVQKYWGEFCIFRANIAMDAICRKYNLYEE